MDEDAVINESGFSGSVDVWGGGFSSIAALANIKFLLPIEKSKISPYILGSVGCYDVSQ